MKVKELKELLNSLPEIFDDEEIIIGEKDYYCNDITGLDIVRQDETEYYEIFDDEEIKEEVFEIAKEENCSLENACLKFKQLCLNINPKMTEELLPIKMKNIKLLLKN